MMATGTASRGLNVRLLQSLRRALVFVPARAVQALSALRAERRQVEAPQGSPPPVPQDGQRAAAQAAAVLDVHLRLDAELDKKLGEAVEDTENSALAIIGQVRELYDSASVLVRYLDGSSLQAGDLGKEIVDGVTHLSEIGDFVERMPAKIERDLANVQLIAQEIKALGGLVEAVQAISMQSHLLAINAAIEASRAGKAGATFRIIADEVRSLASNSNLAAAKIRDGLGRMRHTLENGVQESIAESSQQLQQVSRTAASIRKLQDSFEDMSQYYKTRFAVVTKHNEDLATNIAEVLGQIQYQDVVRQCIARIQAAMQKRNALFGNAVGSEAWQHLPALLEQVLDDYLKEEHKHLHSARHDAELQQDGIGPKIELF